MQYEIISWDEAYNMCYYLFEKLINANEFPDIIVGIARGGWIPARLLSDFYGNKFTANIKIEFYKDTSQIRENPIITQELTAKVKNKSILIVDDVADSGKSLQAALNHIETKEPRSIKTATLHYKKHSVIVPDFYINLTDKWIVYPWEYGEFIAFQYNQLKDEYSVLEIKKQLKDIGIPPHLVESYFEKVLTSK